MCSLHCPHGARIDPDYVLDIFASDILKKTSDWAGHCPVYVARLTLAAVAHSCKMPFLFASMIHIFFETTLGSMRFSTAPVTISSRHLFYIRDLQLCCAC